MNWMIFLAMCCMIFLLAAWIRKVKKCDGELAKVIVRLLGLSIFALAAQGIFIVSGNETVACLALSCYYASLDWLVISMLVYVEVYTGVFRSKKTGRFFFKSIAVLDNLFLLSNVFFGQVFTLQRHAYGNGIGNWDVGNNTPWFIFHIAFTYIIIGFSVMSLIAEMLRIPSFYRGRFRVILFLFLAVVALNGLCIIFAFPFDFSVVFYGILAIQICYYSLFFKPTGLINNTLSMVVADISDAVFCFDLWGECVYINKKVEEYFPEKDRENAVKEIFADRIRENRARDVEFETWDKNMPLGGKKRFFNVAYQKLSDQKKQYIGCFFTIHDRTDEILRFQEEHYRITHDRLTGLYNREYFFEKVEERLKENPDEEYCILCSNIKGFKLYNELFGTAQGDEVLKEQAALLRSGADGSAVYGRISGDEFALMIPREKCRAEYFIGSLKKLKAKFDSSQYQIHVYAGVYDIVDINEPVAVMCDKAKLAIESNRGDYNAIITYYDNKILEKSLYERQIVGEFDKALEEGQFRMFLQPQITSDGTILGAEALVRWMHPVRGLVFPGDFIEVFERTGLIYRLDRYMWELAAGKLREWQDAGRTDLHISVNISAKDFYCMDIYKEMTGLVEKYEIAPANLKLEITETVLMTEMKNQVELLERLRDFGFQIEIDDFGSGYSSLNMLKNIDVDIVKIDMGFLHETERVERSASILNNIIALVKQLGMGVITEGVETREQVDRLTKMGCHMFQGYYFAKPMPVESFEEKYR